MTDMYVSQIQICNFHQRTKKKKKKISMQLRTGERFLLMDQLSVLMFFAGKKEYNIYIKEIDD